MTGERVSVSHSAVVSYRILYPAASGPDLAAAIRDGVEVTEDVGAVMPEWWVTRVGCRYVLHPERTGLAMLAPSRDGRTDTHWHVVSFLRFRMENYVIACQKWPGARALTAAVRWGGWAGPIFRAHEAFLGGPINRIRGTPWPGGLPALDEAVTVGRARWVTDTDAVIDLADGSAVIVRTERNRRTAQWRSTREVSGGL